MAPQSSTRKPDKSERNYGLIPFGLKKDLDECVKNCFDPDAQEEVDKDFKRLNR
jgi:hypothetical protein